ncbi:MAG: ankyrin repeat domain-containing protein [Gammaproteobacteria bacterium]|jgi:ankyrin repeat protein
MKQSLRITLMTLIVAIPLMVTAKDDMRLIDAAKSGDFETIESLLNSSIDINVEKADGTTALHYAGHRDDLDIARLLTKSGANTSAANVYGVTPLSLACINRSADMVKILLNGGANPNTTTLSGESILMNCARTGATNAVSALLDAGADANIAESNMGLTALMWAAEGGHSEIVQLLIDNGADVTKTTKASADKLPNTCRICAWKPSPGGFTALMYAARGGDVQTARLLLEAGADINQFTAEHGNSLVLASASGHENLALFLLASGSDTESKDENGVTALHHAHQNGLSRLYGMTYDPVYRVRPDNMPRLARALLEAGSDPNAQISKGYRIGPAIRSSCEAVSDMVGATPFMLAAISADPALLRLLNDYEADPQIGTSDGTSPLMVAAKSSCNDDNQDDNLSAQNKEQSLQAVMAIVEMGADINVANKSGETALHKAAFSGTKSVVQYLADNGAIIDVVNKNGETPWSMASGIAPSFNNLGSYGTHPDTADALLKLGAKPITREDMNTPDAYSNFLQREISIDYGNSTAQPK